MKSEFSQSILPTHTFETAPPLDVLIIPGGGGVRAVDKLGPLIEYVKTAYPSLKYLFTICSGSWIAARAGVLDGKRATSNKASWAMTKELVGPKWVSHARWVTDGNIWTASGVSAGIDAIFAFMAEVYGKEVADEIAVTLEYDRHQDSTWDPFAEIHGLEKTNA
jgi:transcriptional regulator GlxA family with amidase domain